MCLVVDLQTNVVKDEDEVQDLFATFVSKGADAAQRTQLAELLALPADKAASLAEQVEKEGFELSDIEESIF